MKRSGFFAYKAYFPKMIKELFEKSTLIFGCGNPLFGDDGFGPAVIEHLHNHHDLPDGVMAEDAGTSIGDILFDLVLSPVKPRKLFIVDAVCLNQHAPGHIFEMSLDQIPAQKSGDFCLHQFPSVNLLRELRQSKNTDIRILAAEIENIPESVRPGLSEPVKQAIPPACEWLLQHALRFKAKRPKGVRK